MNADFISREDALEVVLPHLLDVDKEGGPGLGQIALVQTPQIFYNRNVLVSAPYLHTGQPCACFNLSVHQSVNQPINPASQQDCCLPFEHAHISLPQMVKSPMKAVNQQISMLGQAE
jgi:hypothetical protein